MRNKHVHIDLSGICSLIVLFGIAVILSIPFWFLALWIIDIIGRL